MVGKGECKIRAFTSWASFLKGEFGLAMFVDLSAGSFLLGAGHCPYLISLDSLFPFFL